jgi:hypothetical protein
MADNVATIVGYILFSLSEILPFINVPTNGFLHTFILGFSNAFKNKQKDIEMAQNLVEKQSFADIINTVSTNPQIKTLFDTLINDPSLTNTLHSVVDNKSLYIQLQKLVNNTQLQSILNTLIGDQQFCNNISVLSPNTLKLLTPQNTTLLNELSKDPSALELILSIDPSQKQDIFNIISILKSHPELVSNINNLVNQAVIDTVI